MRYLYWFLGLCGIGPVFSVAFVLIARTIPAPVLVLAQGCRSGGFFPDSVVFALVMGTSVLASGILALPPLFLGYAYGVAFIASVCLSSASLYPAVASLVGFSCGLPSFLSPGACPPAALVA